MQISSAGAAGRLPASIGVCREHRFRPNDPRDGTPQNWQICCPAGRSEPSLRVGCREASERGESGQQMLPNCSGLKVSVVPECSDCRDSAEWVIRQHLPRLETLHSSSGGINRGATVQVRFLGGEDQLPAASERPAGTVGRDRLGPVELRHRHRDPLGPLQKVRRLKSDEQRTCDAIQRLQQWQQG